MAVPSSAMAGLLNSARRQKFGHRKDVRKAFCAANPAASKLSMRSLRVLDAERRVLGATQAHIALI